MSIWYIILFEKLILPISVFGPGQWNEVIMVLQVAGRTGFWWDIPSQQV
jgi:hypothetical protein